MYCQYHSKTTYDCQIRILRKLTLSSPRSKIVPNNLKNKSKSSQDWLTRQLNDQYVKKSRFESYRCRSAFKLLEIHERFKILKPGMVVVDCGAAPGSWTQVLVKNLISNCNGSVVPKSTIVAVDLQHMEPLTGAIVLSEKDFTQQSVQDEIRNLLPDGKADLVVSDMAPRISGIRDLDAVQVTNLVYSALGFSYMVLKTNGSFLCKTFDFSDVSKMVQDFQKLFSVVKRVKPNASRSDSAEVFLLGTGFKGDRRSS